MKLSRRDLNKLVAGSLAAPVFSRILPGQTKKPNSKVKGVQIGVQTYSFRDRSLDEAIKAMVETGLSSCELWQGHLEPTGDAIKGPQGRESLRKWRLTVPLDEFKAARAKLDQAGIELYAYNLSFRDDFTDGEMERGFEMAKALGVKILTASSNVSTVKRIDGFARKYKIRVGMHNHSNLTNPNEYATAESFARALEGNSEYMAINLDIGHFTAANFDAVDFLRRHHDRIVTMHIKDRKRNQGENVPFGEGDTPIKAVLALLRDQKWRIPANIEYEYKGSDTVHEVKRCLEYCKRALEA
jgi:sugar phosphate isomerase/epimerase